MSTTGMVPQRVIKGRVSHKGVRNNSRGSAISSRNVLEAWSNHCTCTRSSSALICTMRPNLNSIVRHDAQLTTAEKRTRNSQQVAHLEEQTQEYQEATQP